MPAYRAAHSKETLKSVEIFKFDKKFNNWRDLSVFKSFVTDPRKAWTESYGLSYASPVPMDRKVINLNIPGPEKKEKIYFSKKDAITTRKLLVESIDSTKCHLKCAHLVSPLIH